MLYKITEQQARLAPLFASCQIQVHQISEDHLLVTVTEIADKKKWKYNWQGVTHGVGGFVTGGASIAAAVFFKTNGDAIAKVVSAVMPSLFQGVTTVQGGQIDMLSTQQRLVQDHWMQQMSASQKELAQASDKVQDGVHAMMQIDSQAKQSATGR